MTSYAISCSYCILHYPRAVHTFAQNVYRDCSWQSLHGMETASMHPSHPLSLNQAKPLFACRVSISICSHAVSPRGCAPTARTCACQHHNNTNDLLVLGPSRRHTYSTSRQHWYQFIITKAHLRNNGRWCQCSCLTFGTSILLSTYT